MGRRGNDDANWALGEPRREKFGQRKWFATETAKTNFGLCKSIYFLNTINLAIINAIYVNLATSCT